MPDDSNYEFDAIEIMAELKDELAGMEAAHKRLAELSTVAVASGLRDPEAARRRVELARELNDRKKKLDDIQCNLKQALRNSLGGEEPRMYGPRRNTSSS